MLRPHHALLAVLCALLATGCISKRRPLILDSTPPGAVIYVDGVSSGHSTPCAIGLSNTPKTLEFRLDGYQSEFRDLRVGGRSEVVYWTDGVVSTQTWPFFLWLGWEDLLFPIKEDDGLMPRRIHVDMRRVRQPVATADGTGSEPLAAAATAPRPR